MQWNEFRSHIGHLSTRDQQRVHEAFELGKKMHNGQRRKSGEPYFSHPIAVADILADMGADPETIIGALLHDTIEDTPLTLQEIEGIFGKTVGALIDGVTKLSVSDVADQPNLNEQIETLRKMFTLMEKDVRIMVIKLVDRMHNMQTAEFLSAERQRLLAEETLDVYAKIADRLCMQDMRDELEGLALSVLEPALFTKLSSLQTQNEQLAEDVLKFMRQKIRDEHPQSPKELKISCERKTWDNLREQLLTEGTVVTGISAITVAFVCPDLDCCYRTLGLLHQLWKREAMSFQDFINSPAINGYQGLHTTVILENGTRVRCKIRTREMHEYARKGVAIHCFGIKSPELLNSLIWTERISPLSQDTEGRSTAFWQTLQSDILGESIVIHGPADQSVTVPKGSTALDGAFYLFRDEALNTTSISIGGKDVPFSTPLEHANSLNVTVAGKPKVERKWLEYANTGFAMAKIRTALAAGRTEAEKTSLGKELFQRMLTERKRGFIEEFEEQSLQRGLLTLGYPRLNALYMAIADGRIEPAEAYKALFEYDKHVQHGEKERSFHLSYSADTTNTDTMDRLSDVHRKYRRGITDIRYKRDHPRKGQVFLRGKLTPPEQRSLINDLSALNVKNIRLSTSYSTISHLLAVIVLVSLWGLDPVLASSLLMFKISAIDLTLVRFLTFWGIAAIIYARQHFLSKQKFKPLDPLQPDLILSGLALFGTALATYFALVLIAPTQYIIFIIGGVITHGLLLQKNPRWWPLLVMTILAAVLGVLSTLQGWSETGFIMATVSSIAFVLYSNMSKRYQEEKAFIRARYPAYLFWVSSIGLLCCAFLVPFSLLLQLPVSTLGMAVLFSLVFNALPYVLYFELMRRMDIAFLNNSLPFVCVATLLGETLMTRSFNPLVALALVPVLLLWFFGAAAGKRHFDRD